MNNPKLTKIRRDLDKLDVKLLNIIKKRNNLVKDVLKLKNKKSEIVDNQRIKIILKSIKKKSIKMKIDPDITKKIWKAMIQAFIDFEYKNFKK
jgi:chorismate mutase